MRFISCVIAAAVLAVGSGCANAQEATLISSLQRLAEARNAEAIYHLGMAYHTGSGVKEDHAKALGDPLASYKLGCYFDGQGEGLVANDPTQALKYKLVAAEAGYALAQQDVAVLYARGGDVQAGLAWLEKSADQGWPDALAVLSSVYNGATGVKPDAAKTAAYFQLFLARREGSDQQRKWLADFEGHLAPEDRRWADELVRSYRPVPTQLTLKALSGQRAAGELVEKMR